jgi:3-oxoacyl-[acyl-carrier-protein] synthase II
MPPDGREAVITGIGLVSCLGEGPDAHWSGLAAASPVVDEKKFAPYTVHPMAAIDFDRQIPKKSDQRQMEPFQRIGTYAAGLALDSAGAKADAELLARMDMIVAAGGGERDIAVDEAIVTGLISAADPDTFLNTRLMSDLRPTLSLAQLPNLLAGNISIVHGVTGSSRTFMGEESSGVDALRITLARIAAGQSDITLVGGAHNGERMDLQMLYEFNRLSLKGGHRSVWQRGPEGGLILGSMGAFLVIESRDHAKKRGARPIARLTQVLSERSKRRPGDIIATLEQMWAKLTSSLAAQSLAILSGVTGTEPATAEERTFLAAHADIPVRAAGTVLGHGFDSQFPMNIALAALAIDRGKLFPAADASGVERPMQDALRQVVVTSIGHWRGEGMALVDAA